MGTGFCVPKLPNTFTQAVTRYYIQGYNHNYITERTCLVKTVKQISSNCTLGFVKLNIVEKQEGTV